ncbi:MAG TPA: PAS domain S-box protein [Actinomycetota bacterium]
MDMHNLTERGHPPAFSNPASDHPSLVESATDAIFTIQTDGTLGSLNPAFQAITGWPCDEWVGKPFHPLVHPEDLPLAMDLLARALDGEALPAFELRILASSGEYLTGEFTASPLREGGRVVSVMGIGRDVTDRKRAQRDLHRRAGILEAVTFAAERFVAGGSWRDAIDVVLQHLGEAAEADWVALSQKHLAEDGDFQLRICYEWARPEIPSKMAVRFLLNAPFAGSGLGRWPEVFMQGGIIHGHVRDLPEQERPLMESNDVRSFAVVPVFAGEEWWGNLGLAACNEERSWSAAEVDAVRAAAGLVGAAIRQERGEVALRETEERYRRLVELSPDAIVVHSEGRFVFANSAAARLFGAETPDVLIGRPVLEVVHPDYWDAVNQRIQQETVEGQPVPLIEEKFVRLDGAVIDVEVAGIPFTYAGRPAGQIVVRDITDRKRVEADLRQRNEYLSALHDTALGLMNRLELRDVLEAIVSRAAGLVGTGEGCIYLVHPLKGELELHVGLGAFRDRIGECVRLGEGLAGRVWELGEPLLVEDYAQWEGRRQDDGDLHAGLAAPLKSGGQVLGVIGVAHTQEGRMFTEEDVALIDRFAKLASIALDNARLYSQAQEQLAQREQAEHQLRRAEDQFRSLVERIPAITYTAEFGETAPWLYVSPQIEDILGFTPDEWMTRSNLWSRQLHPEDRDRVMAEEERSQETGEPNLCEYRLFHKDGRVVWVRDESVVVRGTAGGELLQGVIFDVTQRKQAEEQLREAEERYRTLVEQIPAVTYIDSYDGIERGQYRTMYVSPQIEEMLGYSPDEFMARPDLWPTLIHPEDRDTVLATDAHHYETGEPLTQEYRLIDREERIHWVLDKAVAIRDESGRLRFSQGMLYDITDRKRMEDDLGRALAVEREAGERLRALDELKNTFLHAVSHELRTPLAAVLGFALTLQREEVELDAKERLEIVHRLAANARKLDQLLSDLLDLDRLDRGIMEPRRRPTDVAALVRRTVESSDVLGTRPVRVDAQLVVAPIDGPKVERIVENLLANAARHTPPGSSVWVRVDPHEGGVLIAVEDDGTGVPEHLRESVFEPFRQGPQTRPHAPGVGIGLSLVARFAELHGGKAWVEERPGGGASFKVFLPGGPA